MNPPVLHTLRKICATLCVALALVFTGAGAASVINDVQHMTGTPGNHEHVMFSNISLDDHDHHSDQHSGHAGGHHHHGDIATGMPLFALTGIETQIATGDRSSLPRDHVRVSIRQSLPERPPRA